MIVQLDLDEAERHRIKRPSSAPVLDRQDGSWWGTIVSLGRTISGMMTGTAEDNGFGNTRSGTVGAGARSGLGRRLGSDIAGDMDGGLGNGPGLGLGIGIGIGKPGSRQGFPRLGKTSLMDAPDYSVAEVNSTREDIRRIDKRLLVKIEDHHLWRKRAEMSGKMKAIVSAIVAQGTASILECNQSGLLAAAMEFARTEKSLSRLFDENLPALERGNLLSAIRNPALDAELHYLLHLAFAWRFNDSDIFRQAVDSMRSGYAGEKRPFHSFKEGQVVGPTRETGANSIGLMTANDLPRIRMNVNNFLLHTGCATIDLVGIARAQFTILLGKHLSPEIAAGLLSPMPLDGQKGSILGKKWKDLDSFPKLPEDDRRLPSTNRWLETITMEKIREISLSDMFTGKLYRPSFMFVRDDPELSAEFAKMQWMKALPEEDFPATSDGKPIARAIYRRFSSGNADWSEYFTLAAKSWASLHTKARAQRLLLLLVTEFSPLQEFGKFIEPLILDLSKRSPWDLYSLTLYCDIYRLSLVFQRKVDEQRLFNIMLDHLPGPPHGWSDFRDSAEHFILCLFLNGSPVRRFQLDQMAERTMRWLHHAVHKAMDEKMVDEILTLLSFLEVGTLADLVPENLEQHQFQERRRAVWMEHAQNFSSDTGFQEWVKNI